MRMAAAAHRTGAREEDEMKSRPLIWMLISIISTLLVTCMAASALAQGLPKASRPEDVGLSSERLKRVTASFQAEVENGKIPGAVILIARNGKVAYFEAMGFQEREKQLPMTRDAIFRSA